jgi:hypothetical protein
MYGAPYKQNWKGMYKLVEYEQSLHVLQEIMMS